MNASRHDHGQEIAPKAEYSVQFECISTFNVYFEAPAGLRDAAIIARALEIARATFNQGGNIMLEQNGREASYALVATGVDPKSALVLGKPAEDKPRLRLLKLVP